MTLERIIVFLKDGKRVELSEEGVREIRGALVLKAVHGM